MGIQHNKVYIVIVLIATMLIPIIYSFFYLKSYWDPYGNLTDMRIAVVNLDEGKDGTNEGEEFVNELTDDGTFNICSVSAEEANEGLKEGNYQAVITIPENFTSSLKSADSTDKQIATVTYTPNKAYNYLGTQIVNSAMKTIEMNLRSKVSKEVVNTLSENINDIPDKLQDISDGTQELIDGTGDLKDGLKKIEDGTGELATKYTDFDNGIQSAYDGSIVLTNGLNTANSGMDTLDQGLTKLDSGLNTLQTQGSQGISDLLANFKKLSTGAKEVSNGVTTLVATTKKTILSQVGDQNKDGSLTYEDITTPMAQISAGTGCSSIADFDNKIASLNAQKDQVNATITSLNATIDSLNTKITQLSALPGDTVVDATTGATAAQALAQASTGLQQASAGLTQATAGLTQITTGIATLETYEGTYKSLLTAKTSYDQVVALDTGAKQVSDGAATLASDATATALNDLSEGITTAKTGVDQLKSGSTQLKDGTSQLANGSETLKQGLYQLNTNSGTIKEALNKLNSGAKDAYDGSGKVIEGLQELKTGVDDGIVDAKESMGKLEGLSDFVEEPVDFEEESYGECSSYGLSFLPLFLSIGLWVGALMCYVVFYYDQRRKFKFLDSSTKNKFLQNFIYIIIGAAEGLITSYLLKLWLGFDLESPGSYYLAGTLIGISFMSIIQFFIRNMGDAGKLISLIILVLQLAASGGTFPIETIDKGFRVLTPYLPMTYSIKLLKEITISSPMNYSNRYIAVLLIVAIICYIITNINDIFKKRWEEKEKEKFNNRLKKFMERRSEARKKIRARLKAKLQKNDK